jgi:hypothetical protein
MCLYILLKNAKISGAKEGACDDKGGVKKIAYNVKAIRRFYGCDKGTRSVPATTKMWRKKNAQRP